MTEKESGTPVANQSTKSSAEIRDELIGDMAALLLDILPPNGQRVIALKMRELRIAVDRELQERP